MTRYAFILLCVATGIVLLAGCKSDSTNSPAGEVITPITDDLFPVVVGHQLVYDGYATQAGSGSVIPDPNNVFRTSWTIASSSAPSPLLDGTAIAIVDSTTGPFGPGGAAVTVSRVLLARKDNATGDLSFLQSIGPFKRAFGIPVGTEAKDTLIWVPIARASRGVGSTGGQWLAYDSTFTGTGGSQARLQVFGRIEVIETISDSANQSWTAYRSRTWRKITLGGVVVQDDATTSRLWFVKDVGPVTVRIVEDTENIGRMLVLRSKNY